jgi:hypothetical protein
MDLYLLDVDLAVKDVIHNTLIFVYNVKLNIFFQIIFVKDVSMDVKDVFPKIYVIDV